MLEKYNMTHDNKSGSDSVSPLNLAEVLAAEIRETKGAVIAADDLEIVFKEIHDHELTALCFSGGGIRSATFGLGIVQALAKQGLLSKFDYLSTVSCGGSCSYYIPEGAGVRLVPDSDPRYRVSRGN